MDKSLPKRDREDYQNPLGNRRSEEPSNIPNQDNAQSYDSSRSMLPSEEFPSTNRSTPEGIEQANKNLERIRKTRLGDSGNIQ